MHWRILGHFHTLILIFILNTRHIIVLCIAIHIEFTMEKKEENYPPYNVFREQYGRLAEEIGISFEESLTRLTRLWALLHGLTAFLISDNVQWNNEWQSCLEKEFN